MELKLSLEPAHMPLAVNFAETAARGAGMDERETTLLGLSVEELFMALCGAMPGAPIELVFRDRRHAVEILLHFPQSPPDLRVFNITARPDHETEEGLASIGLFLASRACEQFGVHRLPGGGWEISLRKERGYPPPEQGEPAATEEPVADWQLTDAPDAAAVKQLSQLIGARYAARQFPEEFTPPGRLLDKLASGDYGAILARGAQGRLAGGLIWRRVEQRIIECFGPYLAAVIETERLQEALCEKVCERFGRSRCRGMVLYAPQAPPPGAGFEPAGGLTTADGGVWAGYRMMAEEFGARALVPQDLLPWYEDWSERMALARDIQPCRDDGESGDGLTLFATRLHRSLGMARLTPLLVGRDAAQVLDDHLRLLDDEGIGISCCVLDTGHAHDALLAPHLLARGFEPRLLVPWGGEGDHLHLFRQRPH